MKLGSKLNLDKYLGIPAIFLLSLVSKLFRNLPGITRHEYPRFRKITVCKFLGMGSIIQSTPLLITLRNNYPDAEISFITTKNNLSLVKTFSFIDQVYTIDDSGFFKLLLSVNLLIITLWKKRLDLYLDLEVHSYFSTVISSISFASVKLGFYRKENWMRLGVYTKMIYYNTKAPVINVYLQAALHIGCKNIYKHLYDFHSIGNEYLNSLKTKLKSFKTTIEEDYIIINPNASELRLERKWNYRNYVTLINLILESYPGKKIMLIGSRDERQYVSKIYNEVIEIFPDKIFNTSGKLLIEELALLIGNCSLMITNDTGPMHLSFALNKKTVALFGPCSPLQYITQENVYFLYKNIYCSPCVHHFAISPCEGDNQCMKLIAAGEVFDAVKLMLNGNYNNQRNPNLDNIIYKKSGSELPLGIVKRK